MKEEHLLTGLLERRTGGAIAKIAGIKLCRRIAGGMARTSSRRADEPAGRTTISISCSHVLPALIRKFHEARMWSRDAESGSRNSAAGFLHVDVWPMRACS